ncbi:mitochondrial import receptor subunit TOM22 homolog [Cylas formicarius]|uniref:mitochondrial import receptor subunit TOM22 homolog n=1 Tax=Cylas formicarius TaxID=197179 RepID=UPI002958BEA6|nr:mitochondrial import receptor subunit TOM22 homolog [Cylas formicarius]
MAPVEDNDSGMESQEGSQSVDAEFEKDLQEDSREKDTVKERKQPAIEASEDNDEPEETFSERLWGLTEMFPDSLRNFTHATVVNTKQGVKQVYNFSRNASWIVFSTSIILFAPLIFEVERANMEEMQRTQQKQMLLGPNSAISGGVPPPLMPPMQQQQR